jgi:hypothetical protein
MSGTTDKIFFQLYNPTGMINQVMSLEIAVGISHETKRPLTVHYVSNSGDDLYDNRQVPIFTPSRWYNSQREGFTNPDQFPHLLDILEFDADLTIIDQKIEKFKQEEFVIEDMLNNYYFSTKPEVSEDELAFAEGRTRIPLDKPIHIKKTLGWYSRFFYDRSPELNKAISSVRFKQVYVDLAKKISASLGDFQGMHLRLSDHVRMFETTQGMFEDWLNRFEQNNLPIVVSTCEPGHKMIQDNKHRFILLDEYIVNNFRDDFLSLPYQDEVIFGLICNLVLHDSVNFVGTSGSTYSAYIHRIRHQKGIETWDFFDNPPKAEGKPYSWNNYPLDLGRKMWWREWEESKC